VKYFIYILYVFNNAGIKLNNYRYIILTIILTILKIFQKSENIIQIILMLHNALYILIYYMYTLYKVFLNYGITPEQVERTKLNRKVLYYFAIF